MRLQSLIACAALVTFLVLPGCAWVNQHQATTRLTRHADHIAAMPVIVESRNGSVEVMADKSASDVQIDATLTCSGATQAEADQRLAQATVSIARDSRQALVISPVFPGGSQGNDGANFTIRLPDAFGITVKTSNGRVALTSLAGDLAIETSNASVGVTDCAGPANITTSNGGVKVVRLAGPLTVRTSNASVDAQDIAGTANVRSSNGSITLALDPGQSGPVQLHTSNASIRAKLSPAFAGSVKLGTSNGSIKVSDPAGRVKSREMDDDSGRLVVGEGGGESSIETSNGKIELAIGG